jgi:hypothetical protein
MQLVCRHGLPALVGQGCCSNTYALVHLRCSIHAMQMLSVRAVGIVLPLP